MVAMANHRRTVRARHICSGKMGSRILRNPYTPIFDSAPVSTMVVSGAASAVGRSQPAVKRNHRRLDRESQECAAKQEHGDVAAVPLMPVQVLPNRGGELSSLRHLGQLNKVEAAAGEKDSQEGQQQSNAAHHGVNKELGRCARTSRAAPQANQEKRRNQAQLPDTGTSEESSAP